MRPGGFGRGNPLHPVHPRLAAQQTEGLGATDREDHFLDAARGAFAERDDLDRQALALHEALVHPVEVGREQRRLVAAGAGADFDDGVAIVQRVARQQQLVELGFAARSISVGSRARSACARAASSRSGSSAISRAWASSSFSRPRRSAT